MHNNTLLQLTFLFKDCRPTIPTAFRRHLQYVEQFVSLIPAYGLRHMYTAGGCATRPHLLACFDSQGDDDQDHTTRLARSSNPPLWNVHSFFCFSDHVICLLYAPVLLIYLFCFGCTLKETSLSSLESSRRLKGSPGRLSHWKT